MKIVHSLGWYFPEFCGGTEVYVDSLTRELSALNVESVIAAPRDGAVEDHYRHHGIEVYRYPVHPAVSLDEKRGIVPRGGFERFSGWLESQKADLYHQHSWTAGCGLPHMQWAKKLGLPTVLTVHLPGNVCMRGTMLRNGKTVCDGKIEVQRCGACWARHSGAPAWVAETFSRLPCAASERFYATLPPSRLSTVLALPFLVAEYRRHFLDMMDLADKVVVPCRWMFDALIVNGVLRRKLILSRQGVSQEFPPARPAERKINARLRIGFFGRWSALKGIDVLFAAVRRLPSSLDFELVVHALAPGGEEQALRRRLLSSVKGEPRISIAEPLPHERIPDALDGFDLAVVPSTCLETGPLVAIEALAAGVPVLGSNLGGIAEWVQHGKNGWLVPFGDVGAWAGALQFFVEDPARLDDLRRGMSPMRTMRVVAAEMAALYHDACRP
jgi:glycosyltransferase involved in cell wall biosynthesis